MRKSNSSEPIVMSLYFLLFLSAYSIEIAVMAENATTSVNIGVVMDHMEQSVGKMMMSCIDMALSDFYASHPHYRTRLTLHTRDSVQDVVAAAAAAVDLIKNVEVEAIMGPTTSMQADFVMRVGEKSHVPIISFTASSPSLTSVRSPYFFRATLTDSSQVNAITALVQAFGWREAVLIYVDNDYGQGIISYLVDALQAIGATVPYRSAISPVATDDQIVKQLYQLMTMQTRVFIIHMSFDLGSRFFTQVREVGMMSEGYVWIMTDGITDFLSSLTPPVVDSMQGALGVRPYVPNSSELKNFGVRWKRKFQQGTVDAELNIYGLWAYDTAIALAMAIEKTAGTANFGFEKGNVSSNINNSTDLATLGVSRNGPDLIQALSNTRFKGLTGDFYFVNERLPSSAFEIVNVIGQGPRRVGFWTPRNGLVRKLSSVTSSLYSTSKSSSVAPVIWPGDSTSVPKGWEMPTNGKKLRIGVPVKNGFPEFVKETRDPITNATRVTGFCIDVFDAVVKELPYSLDYEYIPFANPEGESAGTYNDLVNQVFLGKFDAVVGDTTITANRSMHVDFTLPYTESGVSMLVPIQHNHQKNAWVFLKPLTWDLWAASFCFFVFIGFVVWVLEHRVNQDFRGPPSHQAGTTFCFSFSTMVFAQRERLVSNLARALVLIWCFVVLVLTQSYTASLTSLLTVEKLQPTVTDVNQLIRTGENVGYLKDSFVLGILERLGFEKSKLKVYASAEEWHELFSKGSKNGGISAAFDEVPYIKLFLTKYCSKYTMVEPTFQADGFGFVFPRTSPLVPDISRAILKVKEGDKMKEVEKAWFGEQTTCLDPDTSVSSNSLSLQEFWGLFLIAGVASVLALIIFTAMFLYEHRQVLISSDPEASIWTRILDLFRIFDQKDLKSHTFKKNEQHDMNFSPSPPGYSVHSDPPPSR